jgi:adenine-specific DNA-methyltransferase
MGTAEEFTLPRAGPARERLRGKGQFWTPDWVADFMAAYVLEDRPEVMLDPAVGEGAFFRAAKRYAEREGFKLTLHGRDVDPAVLEQARRSGLSAADLMRIEVREFILAPPTEKYPAIIANPPYIRHHRLPAEMKSCLRRFADEATRIRIDGRAGLHVYFLIRALLTLAPGGRLAYIVSADICEGVFAGTLWKWIAAHYRLDAVITFAPEAAPFPDVDTNALVFLIRNALPTELLPWMVVKERESSELIGLISGKRRASSRSIEVCARLLDEALATGLSRRPSSQTNKYTLGDFATVMRGIVTGDNEFFFMTAAQARERGLPESALVRAIGRTRDVKGERFTAEDLDRLEADGRATWLLSLNGQSPVELAPGVRSYLREGERRGVPDKTLIKTRRPWYRMETRLIPPILFAYLGRRHTRFIRNLAGVVPLTCLLCIYPRQSGGDYLERLWKTLSHPDTIANLKLVGKSYGGDAIKVEPRALERLPLPDAVAKDQGLKKFLAPCQGELEF